MTPFTHIDYQRKGLSIEALLEGLEAGRKAARADFGVEMCWIFDIPRNLSFPSVGGYDPHPAERTLDYALAGREVGVIGFGLGGNEVGAPPEPFAHAFERAHPMPVRQKARPAYGAPSGRCAPIASATACVRLRTLT